MPVPTTTDELLELIRKSELITPQRLEAFLKHNALSLSVLPPRDLTSKLVAAGLITQFQAEQFLQGKWRGFTIGKYRVLERIGSGGMGTVYLCEHMVVGRKVAVKVLPTSQADNPSALGRFYREARAAGVLDHPNLVKAHDIDQDGALHFLVMDYIDGASLQDLVARFGPLSVVRATHYIRQAALGLQAAHDAGLIHRDVKPGNVMVERNGNVRVLDLGLARFYDDHNDLLTLKYDEKNVLGTADYVAPEQALNSHEVDHRADIYSLGATFYFLLTGNPPFAGGRIAQKLIWHQVRQPTPVRQLRPEVPDGLAAVLEKMMAKDPDERYQTPKEVHDALSPWVNEPVPPPTEAEMPRLSPAATSNPPSPSPGGRATGGPGVLPRRSTATVPIVRLKQSSGRVATLAYAPTPAEVATPRNLDAQSPTDKHPLRVGSPVAPSQLLQNAPATPLQGGGLGNQVVRLLVMAIISGVIGVAITWGFLMAR